MRYSDIAFYTQKMTFVYLLQYPSDGATNDSESRTVHTKQPNQSDGATHQTNQPDELSKPTIQLAK